MGLFTPRTIALTGNDTLVIGTQLGGAAGILGSIAGSVLSNLSGLAGFAGLAGGRVITDVADGDYATFGFPNSLVEVKTGKNGNSIYAYNNTGMQVDCTLRLIRSSADDVFMNAILERMKADFASFALLSATFVKRVGNGAGAVSSDTYILSGGVFTKQVEATANAEGDTDQAVSVYELKFTNSSRAVF